MPTCAECGDASGSTTTLTCSDCEQEYCRDHYHSHSCEPLDVAADGEIDRGSETNVPDSNSSVQAFGYVIGAAAGLLGTLYLLLEIDAVISGATGTQALQAVMHLVVAGAFFSLGTFLLVATYISSSV